MNKSYLKFLSLSQYLIFISGSLALMLFFDIDKFFINYNIDYLNPYFFVILLISLILAIFNTKTFSKYKFVESNWALILSSIFMIISILISIGILFIILSSIDSWRQFSSGNNLLLLLYMYPILLLSYIVGSFFSFIAFLKKRKL